MQVAGELRAIGDELKVHAAIGYGRAVAERLQHLVYDLRGRLARPARYVPTPPRPSAFSRASRASPSWRYRQSGKLPVSKARTAIDVNRRFASLGASALFHCCGSGARGSRRGPGLPLLNAVPRRVSACRGRGRRTDRRDQGAAMARAGAPWAARAGVVRDRREAERHGVPRSARGLGGVALVGLRRDGMPGGRAFFNYLTRLADGFGLELHPALTEAARSGMPLRRNGGQ